MSAPAEEHYELFPISEIDTPLIQGKRRSSIREYVQRHMKSVPNLACPSIFATIFKVFRHSILSWISFLLAVAFYVLTVLYAWRPELVSRIELFGGSPAKAIRLLAILSGIANPMLTATISHSFNIVHWTLVARPRGHCFTDYLALEPGTGIEGLFHIMLHWRLPRLKSRAWSIFKLLSMTIATALGILILSNVEARPTFYPATNIAQAHGYGIGTFNASLAPLLQPTADLLLSSRFKDFLSDSDLAVDITQNGDRKHCVCHSQNRTYSNCRTRYFVPGGIENAAPVLLASNRFVQRNALIQPVLAMNQRGYNLEFDDGNMQQNYNPDVDCITHGFSLGAFQLCLKDGKSNEIQAYITPCPRDLASKTKCLSNTTWQSPHEGWGTTLSLFARNATIAYNGLNGTILSYEFSPVPRTAVDISAHELLRVFDTMLGPVNRSTTYGQLLTVLDLGFNKPAAPLTIWEYFQGLYALSKHDCRANRRAINGLQSLLAIPIYHCQAKDFAELRKLLLSPDDTETAYAGQIIISLFPEVLPDTDIFPALLRYTLNVGRRSLLAYIVLAGFTLTLCLVALIIGSCTLAGRRGQGQSSFSVLNQFGCKLDNENGNQVQTQDLTHLNTLSTSEKLLETAKMRVKLPSMKAESSLERNSSPYGEIPSIPPSFSLKSHYF